MDFGALEEAQELRFNGEVEVADLVEKQGASLGGADESRKGVDRARESPAAVPEDWLSTRSRGVAGQL